MQYLTEGCFSPGGGPHEIKLYVRGAGVQPNEHMLALFHSALYPVLSLPFLHAKTTSKTAGNGDGSPRPVPLSLAGSL